MLLENFFKKYFRQISVLGAKRIKPGKIKAHLFFLIAYSSMHKIDICPTFLRTKIPKKKLNYFSILWISEILNTNNQNNIVIFWFFQSKKKWLFCLFLKKFD